MARLNGHVANILTCAAAGRAFLIQTSEERSTVST